MLAVYLMAGWISLISATNAAEQTVQQLEEQPRLCKIDRSTYLQLDETSRPWDRPVNVITAATPVARQTSLCDNPTATASRAARRTDSPYIPLTIDGPVTVKSSIDDTFASSNIWTVDGPIGDASLVKGVAALSPDPLAPKIALMIETPSRDMDQLEVAAALNFGPLYSAIPLTTDGPRVLDTILVNVVATFYFGPLASNVPLTIDDESVDTASANGGALGLSPSITEPLAISGEETSSNTNESGQTIPLMLLVHPMNKSPLTGFDSTELHQAISAPQTTISGVIPHGQSPAAVTDNCE